VLHGSSSIYRTLNLFCSRFDDVQQHRATLGPAVMLLQRSFSLGQRAQRALLIRQDPLRKLASMFGLHAARRWPEHRTR
jgi:hypothetical protein